ncbi:beta-microseminoprotein-like isoform X2 [Engystomops pustulosus]|uniref:beta-microseminoprotein-like isoform X2 n=1 Tax=Engystomops pustulosus TaxID=76066 RepID=UPI003AFA0A4B
MKQAIHLGSYWFIQLKCPGCNYGGEFHKFGSSWKTNTCKKCDCYPDGAMGCCDIGGYPGNYDKEKCKIIYDKDHCPITVVRKDDPRKTCPHSMVG